MFPVCVFVYIPLLRTSLIQGSIGGMHRQISYIDPLLKAVCHRSAEMIMGVGGAQLIKYSILIIIFVLISFIQVSTFNMAVNSS